MINSLSERMTASRSWAIGVGIAAAVVAGLLLLLYLDRYRNSIQGDAARSSVLVANSLIVKGTPGDLIAAEQSYTVADIQRRDVKSGAVVDPAYLNDRVASADIYPGQQITTADFSSGTSSAVDTQITGKQRAISVNVDNVHGSLSQLESGDRVDLYVSLGAQSNGQPLVKLFKADVLVLTVPNEDDEGNLMLRIDQNEAADFAYAADNTQMYFVIRPSAGATPTRPDAASIQSVLNSRPRGR